MSKEESDTRIKQTILSVLAIIGMGVLALLFLVLFYAFLFTQTNYAFIVTKSDVEQQAEKVIRTLSYEDNDQAKLLREQMGEVDFICSPQNEQSNLGQCLSAYEDLNDLIQAYYNTHQSKLDEFDPELSGEITKLDKLVKELRNVYETFPH